MMRPILPTLALVASLLAPTLAAPTCSHVCVDICAHAWNDCTTLLTQTPSNFELCKQQDKACQRQCAEDECANPELYPSLPHTNFITANDAPTTTTSESAKPTIEPRTEIDPCIECLDTCDKTFAGCWGDPGWGMIGVDRDSWCAKLNDLCTHECLKNQCKPSSTSSPPAIERREAPAGVCGDTCAQVLPECVKKWDSTEKCVKQHVDCLTFCADHPDIAPYVLPDGATIVVHPPVDFVPPPGSTSEAASYEKRCAHTCDDFCPYVLEKCLWNPPECSFGDFCSIQDQKCNQWCREVGKCHPKTSHDGSVIVFNDPKYDVPFGAGCSSQGVAPTTLSRVVKPSEVPSHTTPVQPNDMPEAPPAMLPPVKRQSERCQAFCTDACNETRKLCEKNGNYDCEAQQQACLPKCYDTWCGVFDNERTTVTASVKRDGLAPQGDCAKCEEACANSYFICLVGSGPECWYQYETCIPMCYKDRCPNVPTPPGPTEPPKETQKRDEQGACPSCDEACKNSFFICLQENGPVCDYQYQHCVPMCYADWCPGAPVPASATIDKRQLSPVTGCNPCVKDDFYEKKMCLDRAKKDARNDRVLYKKKQEKCKKASKKRLENCKPCMDFS